jgi:hypothetical protein
MNCPGCGKEVPQGSVRCPHCGTFASGGAAPKTRGILYAVLAMLAMIGVGTLVMLAIR